MRDMTRDMIGGLEAANRKIHTLYNSVPGGIFQCLYDDDLTLLEMSEGFLNMIGYTREQIREEAGGSLRKLIEPGDMELSSRELEKQLKVSNTKEIQYRLIHRDGHYINVLDRGTLMDDELGRPAFYCIVVDITKEKQMEDALRLSLDRYQIITNQTNDVIFEWDIVEDTLVVTSNWEKKFGKRKFHDGESLYDILDYKSRPTFVPEDLHLAYEAIRKIKEGQPYLETELRICHENGNYIWCRIRMTQQFDQDGKAIKVIGVLIDIDREVKRSQYLKRQAEQDALTGIYNKMTTQTRIQEYLTQKDHSGTMMIIDIDNFKRLNDSQGHLYGDVVLSNLARNMAGSIRDTDILGRIGGDEFLVFLKEINTIEGARFNAEKILTLFKQLQVNGNQQRDISCSVGISMFPTDGNDFMTLYQRADYALYQAKKSGKNQFAFFDEKTMQRYLTKPEKSYSPVTANIDSDERQRILSTEIVEYVFRVLYSTRDVKSAIPTILETVGNYFHVSRAYIYENIEDGRYCSNTFEWCKAGVEPRKEKRARVSYETDLGGHYRDHFDENNLFYCPDISVLPEGQRRVLASQNILSMLQCAITDEGEFRGFVGFDECMEHRYWNRNQVEMLGLISETISTFLLKSRARDAYRQEKGDLCSILDAQNAWIHVMDPESKNLMFINNRIRQSAPDAEPGLPCYKALLNRETPCENCPAARLGAECRHDSVEMHDPDLDRWYDAEASLIQWNGEEAVMINCRDISRYKK